MKKLFISIMLVAFIVAGCSSNSDKLILKGDIQNNIISATTTVSGKIVKMNKAQGEPVKAGDIIAVIDNTNQKYTVDSLKAVVEMKKAKLDELQAGNRPEQIAQAQAQVRAAKANLELISSGNRTEQIEQAKNGVAVSSEAVNTAQASYDYLNTQYNKALKLNEVGSLSKSDLDDIKYKLDTAANQLSSAKYQLQSANEQLTLLQKGSTSESISAAKANYDAANAQLNLLKSGATKQTITIAQADLDQSIAQLNQAQNNLDNCNITALSDGIIISKNFELGDVVE